MTEVPSEKSIKKDLENNQANQRYLNLLQTEVESKGIGRSTVILYLICSGRKHILTARRLGGAIGLNTKIVDDLLDGETIDPVSDKPAFLQNYLEVISKGEIPEPIDQPEEIYAYLAGKQLYTFLVQFPETHRNVLAVLGSMEKMLHSEDKTMLKPYREYVAAAGGLHGELLVEALAVCNDFDVTEEKREFANCFGKTLQIGDDIVDNDVELEDGNLREEFDRSVTELKSFGYTSIEILTLMQPKHLKLLIEIEKKMRELKL